MFGAREIVQQVRHFDPDSITDIAYGLMGTSSNIPGDKTRISL